MRRGLDFDAEVLEALKAPSFRLLACRSSSDEYYWHKEDVAKLSSRLDYVKERLHLFYVGITRAKRELIVTWNSGGQGDATPSLALSELMDCWDMMKKSA